MNILHFINKKDVNGNTLKEIKKVLETHSHCGRSWGVKAKYKRNIVSLYVEGKESFLYNMKTGFGQYKDLDFDGCCICSEWDFTIGQSKKDTNTKTILRLKE